MTKKCFLVLPTLVAGCLALHAQEGYMPPFEQAGRAFVSVQGGVAANIYENAFSYRENARSLDLFTPQVAAAVGYEFSEVFGVRGHIAYGSDAGAANTRQTSAGGFYPYKFRHANVFCDAVLNLSGLFRPVGNRASNFRAKLYAGAGVARTFDFTDSGHPWQTITDTNTAFGVRGGFIAEYTFQSGLGLFADLCGEAYHDNYNGLQPSADDQQSYDGYGGFPLDLRGLLSLGVVLHF